MTNGTYASTANTEKVTTNKDRRKEKERKGWRLTHGDWVQMLTKPGLNHALVLQL